MKNRLLASVLAALLLLPLIGRADGVADLARAQIVFAQVMNSIQKVKEASAAMGTATATPPEPVAPEPVAKKGGKFFLPFTEEGELTEWANKAVSAQVGAAVGSKVGEKAGAAAASKIPIAGGLLAMGAKKKGKELGALAAVGGADFVKESSSLSFKSIQDLALYMHINCSEHADYLKGFAAAAAIYPDLFKTYEATVKKAYGAK
jgi:hypothetical protein